MVSKLAEQGLQDPWVLQAMGRVERHRFVESALAGQAYEDTSLPIGLGQTISKPNVVARMVELLCQGKPGKLGRVLEIGTGSGFQAAWLSRIVAKQYSIEIIEPLGRGVQRIFAPIGLTNVRAVLCDEAGLYSRYFWDNIQARASFRSAPIRIVTSPYSLNWLYQDFIKPHIVFAVSLLPPLLGLTLICISLLASSPYFRLSLALTMLIEYLGLPSQLLRIDCSQKPSGS
jgi:protein-L-isoaspartate(D-aspartate) O-methyltransferase